MTSPDLIEAMARHAYEAYELAPWSTATETKRREYQLIVRHAMQALKENISNEMAARGAMHLMEKEDVDALITPSYFHRALNAALDAALKQERPKRNQQCPTCWDAGEVKHPDEDHMVLCPEGCPASMATLHNEFLNQENKR